VMTPIILHRMGTEQYGTWVFLGIFSITGYFSLLDLGFGGATIKYVAEYRGRNDHERLEGVVNATLLFFVCSGIIGGLALALFNAFAFDAVFHLPDAQRSLITFLVNLIAISFFFQFPALALSSIIEGIQRYDYLRAVTFAMTVISNLVILLFLKPGNSLLFMVMTSIITALAITVSYGIIVRRILPTVHFRFRSITKDVVRSLLILSSKLFASKIVGLIFNNTDKILIGIFLTVADQTDYDIVNKLHLILLSMLSMFNQAILPNASEHHAQDNRNALRQLLIRMTKYSSAIILPAYLLLLITPKQIITIWVGGEFARLSYLVQLYASHIVITMLVGVSSTMLVSINRVGKALSISIWAAALNFVISISTVHSLGIAGLILGTVISYIISSFLYIRATNNIFGIPHLNFLKSVVLPLIVPSLACSFILIGIQKFAPVSGLFAWFLLAAVTYVVFFVVFVACGMNNNERQYFLGRLTRRGKEGLPSS